MDIPAGLVNVARLGPGSRDVRSYATGDVVSAVVPAGIRPTAGSSRAATGSPPSTGPAWSPPSPSPSAAPTRMNDGKCDPYGGFWAGSMALDDAEGSASLYRLAPDGTCRRALTGVTISNGLAWRDPEHVYYVDTPTRRVDLLTVTPDGAVTDRRPAFAVPAELGFPDGLTIDADGRLWVALWGGGAVACFAPDGDRADHRRGGRGPGELLHVRRARPRDARHHDLAGVLHAAAARRRSRGRGTSSWPTSAPAAFRPTASGEAQVCGGVSYCIAPRRCPRCRGSAPGRRRSGSTAFGNVTLPPCRLDGRGDGVDVVDGEGGLEPVQPAAGARLGCVRAGGPGCPGRRPCRCG